jgi:hypothetical protein
MFTAAAGGAIVAGATEMGVPSGARIAADSPGTIEKLCPQPAQVPARTRVVYGTYSSAPPQSGQLWAIVLPERKDTRPLFTSGYRAGGLWGRDQAGEGEDQRLVGLEMVHLRVVLRKGFVGRKSGAADGADVTGLLVHLLELRVAHLRVGREDVFSELRLREHLLAHRARLLHVRRRPA